MASNCAYFFDGNGCKYIRLFFGQNKSLLFVLRRGWRCRSIYIPVVVLINEYKACRLKACRLKHS